MKKDGYQLHLKAVALVFVCDCVGHGVFARGYIPAGVGVCLYAGRHISEKKRKQLPQGHEEYLLMDDDGTESSFSDPHPSVWKLFGEEEWLPVCYGCMLNHRCEGANCTFEWSDKLGCYVLVTKEEIGPMGQLLVDYGSEFDFEACKCAHCRKGKGPCCAQVRVSERSLPEILHDAPGPWVVPPLKTLKEGDSDLERLRGYLKQFKDLTEMADMGLRRREAEKAAAKE